MLPARYRLGSPGAGDIECTWSENKDRELATVCLPWQQWTNSQPSSLFGSTEKAV